MKNLALLFVLFVVLGTVANAQSRNQILVNIPFDFYVQNQKMPAGEYMIASLSPQSNQKSLVIRKKDGSIKAALNTNTIYLENNRKSFVPTIIFNQYGEDYFLSQILNPLEETGLAVRKTKIEKYLAQKFGKTNKDTVALNAAQR